MTRLASILTLLACALVPNEASAGPYASEAMGNISFSFPSSLHLGGAFHGGFGRAQDTSNRSFGGEGFIEYHALDVLTVGFVMRSQALHDLPVVVGDRANTVRARLRARVPLVRGSSLRRTIVPVASLGLDVGIGWLANATENEPLLAVGTQLRLELVITRVVPFVSVGYDRTRLPVGNVRLFELGVGVSVRIAGRSAFGPRD